MFSRIKKWFARKRKPQPITELSRRYEPKHSPPSMREVRNTDSLSNVTIADMMLSGRHDIPDTYESGHRNCQSHSTIGVSNSIGGSCSSDSGGGGGGCD